jgi:RHS repeat-associated protein
VKGKSNMSVKSCAGDYGYGFNGQEKDDEISGAGNSYTAMFWQYDSRLGRRWNLDPKPNHSISQYATFGNNPILFNDPNGDTIKVGWFARNFQKEKTRQYIADLNSDLKEQSGLTLRMGKKGVLTEAYNIRDGRKTPAGPQDGVASHIARGLVLGALRSSKTMKLKFTNSGNRARLFSNGNSTLFIDTKMTKSLMSNFINDPSSTNPITSKTMGFGMTLYHELDHWLYGSTDPHPGQMGTRPGLTVSNMNIIRRDLTIALGDNYGQRMVYRIVHPTTKSIWVPFTSSSNVSFQNGIFYQFGSTFLNVK